MWFADHAGALGRVTLDTRLGLATPPPSSVAAGSPFGLAVAVTYSETGMLRLLWSLDLSHRKTRPLHPKADPRAQEAFKKGGSSRA